MKARTRLISALLVALMVVTILPVTAFAYVDPSEPEWTEYVLDTTTSGAETAMPIPTVVAPPAPADDFDVEESDPDASKEFIKLEDCIFDALYTQELDVAVGKKDSLSLEGNLPEGLNFDEKSGVISGRALPQSAGRTYVFTVSSASDSKTYGIYVPCKELTSVVVSGIVEPKVKSEPSYMGNVTFMADKVKLLGEQETLSLEWAELTPKDGFQPFPFYKYGYNYRLVATVEMPAGYRINAGADVTLNGNIVRYFINNNGSKIIIVYYFAYCGMAKTPYAITYDFGTVTPTANFRFPKSSEWKFTIQPYNYAPLPIEPAEDGYIFGGWFEDSARTKPFDANTLINHNRMIYAKWVQILNNVYVSTSNIYNSVNEVRPTISTIENAKYRVVGSDWVVAADNGSANKDVLYTGDLLAGETYTLRVAIQPLPTWGVFPDGVDFVNAEANGVPVQNRFSDDRSTLYLYFPVNVLNGTHEHRLQHYREVPATCEKSGTREYWKCRDCGQIFLEEEATVNYPEAALNEPALGHVWGEWTSKRDATCTVEGSEVRVCLNDEHHKETRHVPKIEHSWSDWEVVTEATETKNGKMQRRCEVCHAVESQYIPTQAHEHSLRFIAGTPATCDLTGIMDYYVCSGCNKKFEDENAENEITGSVIIPALGHNWSDWVVTKEPTKQEEGEETRICQNDNSHVEKRPVAKIAPEVMSDYTVAKVMNSNWQKGDKTVVIFTADFPFSMFEGVAIDGQNVAESNYTAVEGRGNTTQVTFATELLNNLQAGEHEVVLKASDGTAVSSIKIG